MKEPHAIREYNIYESAEIEFGLRFLLGGKFLRLEGDIVQIGGSGVRGEVECDIPTAHTLYLLLHEMFKAMEAFNPDMLCEALKDAAERAFEKGGF